MLLQFTTDVLYVFIFKFSVRGDEVSYNFESCYLCEANDTAQKGLVIFFRGQLADDFLARTINHVVLVK